MSESSDEDPYQKKTMTKGPPEFLVDGMLGSLATKLRILGYDTVYDSFSNDEELLKSAALSGRYLLTSDRELFLLARRRHVKASLLTKREDLGRFVELFSSLGISKIVVPELSRCSACNGTLVESSSKTRFGETKHICRDCGKEYWKGVHWKKLNAFFNEANLILRKGEMGN